MVLSVRPSDLIQFAFFLLPPTTHLSLGQFVVCKKESLELYPLQDLQYFRRLGENTRLQGGHALQQREERGRISVGNGLRRPWLDILGLIRGGIQGAGSVEHSIM